MLNYFTYVPYYRKFNLVLRFPSSDIKGKVKFQVSEYSYQMLFSYKIDKETDRKNV